MLPAEKPLRFLTEACFVGGRRICPKYLADFPGLAPLLEIEADLESWHVTPDQENMGDWDHVSVELLPHIRAVSGQASNEKLQQPQVVDLGSMGGPAGVR